MGCKDYSDLNLGVNRDYSNPFIVEDLVDMVGDLIHTTVEVGYVLGYVAKREIVDPLLKKSEPLIKKMEPLVKEMFNRLR